MRVRVKKINQKNIVKMETFGEIKELLINEDLVNPDNESISVCFRGSNSSGIIDFKPSEIESIYQSVKTRIGLVKDAGKIKRKK
jgi:hypothetical protein